MCCRTLFDIANSVTETFYHFIMVWGTKKPIGSVIVMKTGAEYRSDEGRNQSAKDPTDLVLLFDTILAEVLSMPVDFSSCRFAC